MLDRENSIKHFPVEMLKGEIKWRGQKIPSEWKVANTKSVIFFKPSHTIFLPLALDKEQFIRLYIYSTLSRDRFIHWHKRIVQEATWPLEVYYSIFSSYCIYSYMPLTSQDYTYSKFDLAEVMSIASLLKISSMQCNIWCAELLFQKVKNNLALTEEGTWSLLAYMQSLILVLCRVCIVHD